MDRLARPARHDVEQVAAVLRRLPGAQRAMVLGTLEEWQRAMVERHLARGR